MQINTKAFGNIKIDAKEIITLDKGLIGFENLHRFVLLGNPEVDEALVWLQCVDEANLAFVVMQPRFFKPDYKPAIEISEIEELDVEDEKDLLLYSIIVVPSDAKKMTANLKAPVIINVKNNKGKQIILNDEKYKIKHLVLGDN